MFFLANVEAHPHVYLIWCSQPFSLLVIVVPTSSGRPSMVRLPSSTLRTSDQAACPHPRFTHRPCRRQHPPGHQQLQGVLSHTGSPDFPGPSLAHSGLLEMVRGAVSRPTLPTVCHLHHSCTIGWLEPPASWWVSGGVWARVSASQPSPHQDVAVLPLESSRVESPGAKFTKSDPRRYGPCRSSSDHT
jgi:hypothetical protein